MSKSKKPFINDFDEGDEDGRKAHSEKLVRHQERLIEQALKTKNLDKLTHLVEDDEDENLDLYGQYHRDEALEYVSCFSCRKLIIEENDEVAYNDGIWCKSCFDKEIHRR